MHLTLQLPEVIKILFLPIISSKRVTQTRKCVAARGENSYADLRS